MNKNLLKGMIRGCGYTQEAVASQIGISLSRFNAKINETGGAELTLGEARKLKTVLRMTPEQFDEIFFAN